MLPMPPLPPLPPLPVLLQILYASGVASILLVNSIPALRDRFIQYGKTLPPSSSSPSPSPPLPTAKSIFAKLLDGAAALTVPHHFFWHFYAVAIANALFWAYQLATHGSVYRLVVSHARSSGGGCGEGVRIEQVVLALLCFLAQASRRLYECLYIQPRSASRMWIGHYLVGILFYTLMAIAIWAEGMGISPPSPPAPHG